MSNGTGGGWSLRRAVAVSPGLLTLLVLFMLPLLELLRQSWSQPVSRFGLDTTLQADPVHYREALRLAGPLLGRSLLLAGLATALCVLIGYPLAWWIVRYGGVWRPLLTGLVVTPLFLNAMVRAIAWSSLLADRGPLLQLLQTSGVLPLLEAIGLLQDGRLLNTATALVAGLTYSGLPFLVLPLVASLSTIPPELLEAAADLQAGPWRCFQRVVLPLSLPGLVSGCLLTFIPAMGDVVNATVLGGASDRMVGNLLQNLVLVQQRFNTGAALAMVLLLIAVAALLLEGRALRSRHTP
ncbi:MAG: ABC transporter permease [Vulcanococcus sp.]